MSHTIGSWYKVEGMFYMLVQTEWNMYCLIGIDGNRWTNPIKCEPVNNYPLAISEDDFKRVVTQDSYSTRATKADILELSHAIAERVLSND